MKIKRVHMRVLAAAIAVIWVFVSPAFAAPGSGEEQLSLLREIIDYIEEYAFYPAGDRSLEGVTAQSLQEDPDLFLALVESWLADDKYGHFMTIEEYNESFGSSGATSGIGVQIDTEMPAGIYVEAFLPGGGAEKTDMAVGAQIISVDGVDVADMPYLDARPMLIGESGTTVTVGYINPGSAKIHRAVITRAPLSVGNVEGHILEGTDIGYVSIGQFGSLADFYDFDYYYNEYLPENGARSVIIDLRGNPGGQLDTVLNILNAIFQDDGYLLCKLIGNSPEMIEIYQSLGWDEWGITVWQPEHMVVLVDEHSASASEVFSGTLQAHGAAVIVGEPTFGKAHSQYHIELSSGDVLVISHARIELFDIGFYEEDGIIPDYEVAQSTMTGADMGLQPIDTSRALFRQSIRSGRIEAVQERLALLGYYRAAPNGLFDDYTLWCINRFQVSQGLPVMTFAGVQTLRVLEQVSDETVIIEDEQLAFAVELCSGQEDLLAG